MPTIFDHARDRPDELAVIDGTRSRTWAQLADRSWRLAHLLRDDLGLRPGDHIASVLANRVEFYELSFAALVAGVWLVPVNTHLATDEVRYVLEDSGARAIVTDREHRDVVAAALADRAADDRPAVFVVDDGLDERVDAASDSPWRLDGPSGGRMHYTSGTTGRPKGVKRALPATAGEYLDLLSLLGRSVGMDGSGSHLLTGPHYHAAVGGYALFDLCNGAPVIMMPRFDAATTLELLTEHHVAHTHLVPTMMVRLLRLGDAVRSAFDPSSLTLVLHGAAPISPIVKRHMIEWWGPILREYWGTSEAGTFTTIDSIDWLAHPGSVGRALPGAQIIAVDDDLVSRPTNTVGVLYCRYDANDRPFHYHGDHTKTDEAFLPDAVRGPGWFTMGDMGRIDDDGFVHLADRATNMIISGGVNIYPAEVEAVLVTHPLVADVAVFGIPDDEWGEQVKAVVEPTEGAELPVGFDRELIAFARDRLAHFKAPKSVDVVARLPRMPTGKLAVRDLRAPYWQDRDRSI
jgi:long-chain acyl-CoA synthetase